MFAADEPAEADAERCGKRSQNAFVGRSARLDAPNRPGEYPRLGSEFADTVASCDPKPAHPRR